MPGLDSDIKTKPDFRLFGFRLLCSYGKHLCYSTDRLTNIGEFESGKGYILFASAHTSLNLNVSAILK